MNELSKGEEHIMIAIWELKGKVSMRNVHVYANERFKREWSRTTISTFISRLCKKGYLNAERSGRVVYYRPLISKDEYQKDKLQELLTELYDGDVKKLKSDL